jgi:hypothetical protein
VHCSIEVFPPRRDRLSPVSDDPTVDLREHWRLKSQRFNDQFLLRSEPRSGHSHDSADRTRRQERAAGINRETLSGWRCRSGGRVTCAADLACHDTDQVLALERLGDVAGCAFGKRGVNA